MFHKTSIFFLIIFSGFGISTNAQVDWLRCLGGTGSDKIYSIQQTFDGGYILLGIVASNDGDISGNHGLDDAWLVKLNSSGIIEWQKCFGGTDYEYVYSILQTADGGYIFSGYSNSADGDVSGIFCDHDAWIVRLDSDGIIEWQKCMGGSGLDFFFSVQETVDGGIILAGRTQSNDGDVTGHHGGLNDIWVVKLNANGTIQWQKCVGGSSSDFAYSVKQTLDGGYIISGSSFSNDGDISGNHGNGDALIIKLNSGGGIEWNKSFGGTGTDAAGYAQQTLDGGYIIAATTSSNNGDVIGNHGNNDAWIIKTDSTGTIQWQKCLGGSAYDRFFYVKQSNDGGYLISGSTSSNDGDVTGNHGKDDTWIVRINEQGTIQWQECIGGIESEVTTSFIQTYDGGYTAAGYTESTDGDFSGNHGSFDGFIARINCEIPNLTINGQLSPPSGTLANYEITPVNGFQYHWQVTNGSIISGQDSNSISVQWGNATNNATVSIEVTSFTNILCLNSTSNQILINVIGIEEIELVPVIIFPNPFDDIISIAEFQPTRIRLANIYGQTIIDEQNSQSIVTQNIDDGFYILELFDQDEKLVRTKKMIKMN